jgi:L-malate glycosyltransferase
MKVAIIIPSLGHFGPIIAVKNLVKSLSVQGVTVDVFYLNSSQGLVVDIPSPIKINFFTKFDFNKYDFINTHGLKPDMYVRFHKRCISTNIISSMHNYMGEDLRMLHGNIKGSLLTFLWRFCLRSSQALIVSSQSMKDYYKVLAKRHVKCYILEYGVEDRSINSIPDKDFKIIQKMKSQYRLIGSVGVMIKRKGYIQLIDFLKINQLYALVIIGSGPEMNSFLRLVKSNNLYDRVFLPGYKERPTDYYRYFDIYAMTSYSEGCSLAMLEALSKGLPILCSNIKNHRDCFKYDEVGFFKLDDIDSLLNAIKGVENNYKKLSIASRKAYKERYSFKATSGKYMKILNKANTLKGGSV